MTPDPVPRIGQGTWSVTDPVECVDMLSTGFEIGYRHVDTAREYDNENLVGRALARTDVSTEDIFVATKVDCDHLGYDDVIAAAENSCENLGVDVIDLLYVHSPRETYDPEETLPAFDELVDRGAIRHIGLSNFTVELLAQAIEVLDHDLFAHQAETHPLFQQRDIVEYAREQGFHHIAHTPLARGEVFGVDLLHDIARKHDASVAQVTLAWLLHHDLAVIPRSTDPAHLQENYDARHLELDDDDIDKIDSLHEVRQEQINYVPRQI